MIKQQTASKWLVSLLLGFFILTPAIGDEPLFGVPFGQILLTVLVLGMVAGLGYSKRLVVIGVVLAVPAVVSSWVWHETDYRGWSMAGSLFDAALLFFVSYVTVKHLWRQRRVTGEMLRLAVIAYLLLGLAWAELYRSVEVAEPTAITNPAVPDERLMTQMMYFSFVTMTTLGYGDIVPKTDIARMLAMMQALVGQAFMAFVVAKLVSLYWSQDQEKEPPDE